MVIGRSETVLGALALAALMAGTLFYLVGRDPGAIYLLPDYRQVSYPGGPVQEFLCGSLPTFLHVYAFILLSALVLPPSRRVLLGVCGFWVLIEVFFEVGQSDALAKGIAATLPAWFQHLPVFEATDRYFLNGTFDPLDLVFLVLGAIAAYGSVRQVSGEGVSK